MNNQNIKIKIAIFGGSGYGGSELLRILLMHPHAEIALVTANEHAGKLVGEVHRNLYGITDLRFELAPGDLSKLENIDIAFFALPHGQALSLIPNLPKNVKVVDLSGDFRIDDKEVFEQFYKLEHTDDELQKQFVYGLTETNRDAIKSAQYIANPGCFATATLLALAPLISKKSDKLKFVEPVGRIIVDAKTGSSGSGAKAAANTHHPQRMNSFYAYKPFVHQHVPEIEQHLKKIGEFTNDFVFMTHSLPVSRGIFASCYLEVKEEISSDQLKVIYENFYHPSKTTGGSPRVSKGADSKSEREAIETQVIESSVFLDSPLLTRGLLPAESPFVRLVENSPDINWVKNTNFCDISVHANGRQIAVFAAIDNLVKGAAGQAVQNMNLMFGLDETTGLMFTGSNP